jgi:hypothetical protein
MLEHVATTSCALDADVEALHQRCGVYTRDSVVCTLLDAVGWNSDVDLSGQRLLEPAAGDGAFVVEAASRLLDSMKHRCITPTPSLLESRICAFEIHPREAIRARARTWEILVAHGLSSDDAERVSESWVRIADFLTVALPERGFTHVVGNPPYSRWSKIPAAMRARYEAELPRRMTRGDLFLPFLDLGIGYLQNEGRLGFVCTDRWRYMAFAEGFRKERLPEVVIELDEAIDARDAYDRKVDTYPSLVVMRRTEVTESRFDTPAPRQGVTIADAGYRVRVGPALGVSAAFLLEPSEEKVENELLSPWVDGSEIRDGEMGYRGRQVIVMYDDQGQLRDLDDFPLAKARLESFRPRLEVRAIVQRGAVWYRPIDRVVAADWRRPKLLIPELSKVPRVAMDLSGAIPSHGVYAIFAPNNELEELYNILRDGGLAERLSPNAPKINGRYIRAYKRFLDLITM